MKQFNEFAALMTEHPVNAILLILGILLLEIILSFDNAAVLATMVKDLPKEQQAKALKYGILGAYIFRGLALILVESILSIWWFKPIGGAYLIYMAIKHFTAKSVQHEIDDEVAETKRSFIYRGTVGVIGVFWSTVLAVELENSAFLVIGILGIKLCLALLVHLFPSTKWIESEQFDLFISGLTLAIFVVPIIFFRSKKNK